ncbi:phosphoribosyl-dephospho-CoA transferase [Methylobacterium haplocladii]|uniref:Phosphoribosyl-dephospho-CoA transferase n=2 Tax=Methylobacterium haplocladii TaxID=1176176 RepID=A0A512IP97_9HYPH|nr:phosphoribosyl-dephospho-CoA transferase [Methylobacterium haplocladii]GJD83676.1 Phosphoribosyl-dephospho-CoA transferase [Methylobacterium haplocladii]GLS60843.1 phosphoribosyl-dephospho-CoA transferase [Methylobacterium haplocladii]
MLAERRDLGGVPHVAEWAEAGRPLIVRRFGPGEDRDRVPLGLPLPPADGKRRISLAFLAGDFAPYATPTLQDARTAAPASWCATIDLLIAVGVRYGIVPRPFGGLLWQAATGLAYLSDASDLDILWRLTTSTLPTGLLDGLARIADTAPMRLDGEILLPDGAGIHWRELLETPEGGEVLGKHIDRLEMRPVAALRARTRA